VSLIIDHTYVYSPSCHKQHINKCKTMSCCSDKMRLLAILLLLLLSTLCKATITITETGEHFASRPDHLVGIRFLQGVEYMARLQVFADNRHLCPDPSHPHLNLTVQVPFDGLPGT
jgi:hypothetical protein